MQVPKVKVLHALLGFLALYIIFGSVFYHIIEKWNWIDSFYFTVITLSTVGYGDFTPHTNAGKIFTTFFIFIGVGLFIAVANAFLKSRGLKAVERRRRKKAK